MIMARQLEQVLREHTDSLMALPGVVGTAQGEQDGAPCIVVMVAEPIKESNVQIPAELGGYPVDIRVTGEFNAL